jgi:hypothetical protein
MKPNLNFIRMGTLMAALLLSTFSCKKDSSNSSQTADEQTTVDLASSSTGAESLYDDAFDVVVQSSEESGVSTSSVAGLTVNSTQSVNTYTAVSACAVITLSPQDPTVFPKTMTIDYGSGCTSTNGITRKGKLTVSLSGKVRTPGSVISVTFDNYSVNGYQLTGTYALTPVLASGGGINYNITISDGSITLPTGAVYTYSCSETFTQTGGIGTSTVTDDIYSITGNFSYSGNGNTITGTVTTPLIRSADCKNITTGTIAFIYKSINGTLDFGSGTCDNVATLKVGAKTSTVTLPR